MTPACWLALAVPVCLVCTVLCLAACMRSSQKSRERGEDEAARW